MRVQKKLLALLLSLGMAAPMLPPGPSVVFADVQPLTPEETEKEMMNPTTPEWYKEQDDSNPYGYKEGVPFRLYEDAELYTYITDPNQQEPQAYINELYQKDDAGDFLNSENWKQTETLEFSDSTYTDGQIGAHWFVSAVPLDLGYNLDENGKVTPRNTCLAFMGAKKNEDNMDVDVWVYDTKSKKYSNVVTVGRMSHIRGDIGSDDETLMYQVRNFMSLTAGDYDNDHVDSIVAYAACSTGPELFEIKVQGDGTAAPVLSTGSSSNSLLHPEYVANLQEFLADQSVDGHDKLGGSLTTGDVNGDKIDDLVVLSYTQILNDGKITKYGDEIAMPALGVSTGAEGKSGDTLLGDGDNQVIYAGTEPGDSTEIPECTERLSALAPTAVVAKTDLDNGNRIVVCGYKERIFRMKNGGTLSNVERNGDVAALMAYDFSQEPKLVLADGDTYVLPAAFKKGDIKEPQDGTTISKLPVVAVSVDGTAAPDRIFIGGTFWDISDKSKKSEYTVPCLDHTYELRDFVDNTNDRELVDVYIDCMSVQSLTKVGGNYESLAFTLVAVIRDEGTFIGSPYSYFYRAGITGPSVDGQTSRVNGHFGSSLDQLYTFKNPYASEDKFLNYVQFDLVNDNFPKVNCVLCPVDYVDDGLMVRYSGKGITYSDPQILAVLQASPYFKAIGQPSGHTIYSFENAYEYSDETSKTQSVGIGITAEVTTPVIDTSFRLGYQAETRTWSEHAFENSVSLKFSADHDSVVIYRTPVVYYNYDVWKPDTGTWESDAVAISYATSGKYGQLSIKQYNEFVDEYNTEGERRFKEQGITDPFTKLNKIGDGLYLGNEGYPGKYYQGGDAPAGYSIIDDHEHELSYNGGEDSTEFIHGESVTTGSERQNGVTFDFDFKGGSEFAKAGAYFSLEQMSGQAVSSMQTDRTGIETSVANLDEQDLKARNYTDEQIQAFYFSWVPAKWDSGIKYEFKDKDGTVKLSKTVPVYGYALSTVKYPLDLSEATVSVDPTSYDYDGTAKTPSVKVKMDGQEIAATDYSVSYLSGGKTVEKCIEPGTYTVCVKGAGPNVGQAEAEFTIVDTRTDLSGAEVTVDPAEFYYDGTAKVPMVTVKLENQTLVKGTDYEVSYAASGTAVTDCINPGIYNVIIKGKGSYTGSASGSFEIKVKPDPISIQGADVVLSARTFTFNNKVQKPTIVTIGGLTLTEGTDYMASWSNVSSKNAGTYTVTLTGIGNYTGVTKANYTIKAKALKPAVTLTPTTYVFNGTTRTPAVTVKDGTTVLKKTTDYTVTYQAGRRLVGKYSVSVKLKGNYSGSLTKTFTITKANNPLSVATKTTTVSFTTLKSKSLTLAPSKIINIKKSGKGTMAYKLVKASKYQSYFSLNATTGKLTIKKGLKKGTYSLKITVKAAGNANYKASTLKTIIIKIIVK